MKRAEIREYVFKLLYCTEFHEDEDLQKQYRLSLIHIFGDPVEVTVRGYELSLRKADAEMIEVE